MIILHLSDKKFSTAIERRIFAYDLAHIINRNRPYLAKQLSKDVWSLDENHLWRCSFSDSDPHWVKITHLDSATAEEALRPWLNYIYTPTV